MRESTLGLTGRSFSEASDNSFSPSFTTERHEIKTCPILTAKLNDSV